MNCLLLNQIFKSYSFGGLSFLPLFAYFHALGITSGWVHWPALFLNQTFMCYLLCWVSFHAFFLLISLHCGTLSGEDIKLLTLEPNPHVLFILCVVFSTLFLLVSMCCGLLAGEYSDIQVLFASWTAISSHLWFISMHCGWIEGEYSNLLTSESDLHVICFVDCFCPLFTHFHTLSLDC